MNINISEKLYRVSKVKLIFFLAYLLIILNLVLNCLRFNDINILLSFFIVTIPLFLKLRYIYIYIYICACLSSMY